MARTIKDNFWLKSSIAVAVACIWAIAFYLSAKLVYPVNSVSTYLLESWLTASFLSEWDSTYYPPLAHLVGLFLVGLGIKDVLSIQAIFAAMLVFLAFLSFYRFEVQPFFVGFTAFVFSPATLYSALSVWRGESAEMLFLLILAFIAFFAGETRKSPYLFSIAFGALFGLGMLAKWTFWLYVPAFGAIFLLAYRKEARLKMLILLALSLLIVASPWYLLKLDYKTFFATTQNDPSLCCPTYLSRFAWYCKELVNVCGFFIFALLACALIAGLKDKKAFLFLLGVLFPIAILSMPVHVEIRYIASLSLIVAAGLSYATRVISDLRLARGFFLVVFAISAVLQVSRLYKTVDSFANEEFLEAKRFFISALPVLEKRAGDRGYIAFNPLFPAYFGKAVELASSSKKLKAYAPEFFSAFKKEFLSGEYAVIINVMPQDADITDLEQLKRFSYAAGGHVIPTTGEVVGALASEELKEVFEHLQKSYQLLFKDHMRASVIEIWERRDGR